MLYFYYTHGRIHQAMYTTSMKMFEFLKLNSMSHNIIVIQVLDRVYNVTLKII